MAGLDKIKEQILSEANTTAQAKIDAANAEAASILDAAKAESAAAVREILDKAKAQQQTISDRAKSSVEMQERQLMLAAKQEIIGEVLEAAENKVLALGDKEYFDLLEKFIAKYAVNKDGEIYFSKKDLERLPADFEGRANAAAAGNGGSLKLASEAKNLKGGFILVYGGIEENCSIEAIFRDRKDELSDIVRKELFG